MIPEVAEHPCIPGALLMRTRDGLRALELMAVAEHPPPWWPCWSVRRPGLVIPLDEEQWWPCDRDRWGR